jgi:SanA protein
MAEGKAPPRRSRARRLVVRALGLEVVVVAVGNVWIAAATSGAVVRDVAAAPERPVAIVLGNRAFSDGSVSPELAARVRVALDLYRAKKVQTLFLSGAFKPEESYDEPGAMADWLERRGVPRDAMVLDREGFRTAATMADAAARGFRAAIVCTQPYHLPRALYFARHAGIAATGVAAESPPAELFVRAYIFLREMIARPEAVLEVALRGVRGGAGAGSKS